jgi:hypothetical protein
MKMSGLCLVALMSVFAFGFAGSASAKVLLFKPSTSFPFHLSGTGGASKIETVGGSAVEAESLHALFLILSSNLFDARLTFLKVKNALLGSCQTPGDAAGTILLNLHGHFGLSHASDKPAILLLVPSGFSFECGGIVIDGRGSLIGLITKPAILTKSKELELSFKQEKGKQQHTEFLLGITLLTGQDLEINFLGVTNKFELVGLEVSANLKATAGEYELVDE